MSFRSEPYSYNEYTFDRRAFTLTNSKLYQDNYKDSDTVSTLDSLKEKLGESRFNMLVMHLMGSTSWCKELGDTDSFISRFPENGAFGSKIHRLEYAVNSNIVTISFFIMEETK